jgi:putative ABC transport system permease protein
MAERVTRREVWRQDVLGDLDEEFAGVAASTNTSVANRWFWRQTFRLTASAVRARLVAFVHALGVLFFLGDRPMTSFVNELRLAGRTLRRRPGVTIAIVLTLAIGLGMNASIFGMVDALMLKPFAFTNVDRMVMLAELSDDNPFPKESVSPANFADFRARMTSFDGMAAYSWAEVNVSGGAEPERVSAFSVSADFFNLLGARPALGRLLDDRDTVFGNDHQIVLSDAFWRRRFGADPAIVGQTINADGTPLTVVGVAAPGLNFPEGAQAWTPLAFSPKDAGERTSNYLTVFALRKPGVSFETAAGEARTVYAQLKTAYPDAMRTRHIETMTFVRGMTDVGVPTILTLFQVAALLVLMIAGANVVNLLLARSEERQRELSVRVAIGATRVRIIRQLTLESMVLSALAIPGALLVAAAGLQFFRALIPAEVVRFLPGMEHLTVSWSLALWTSLFAAAVGALFGIIPAWQSSRPNLVDTLKDGGRSQSSGSGRGRVRRGLVVAEVAMALPLLVASGLAAMGVQRFAHGDQGYDATHLVRATVVLPDPAYANGDRMRQFTDQWMDAIAHQPGVDSVGASSTLPSGNSDSTREIEVEGRPIDPDQPARVGLRQVTPGLLPTLKIPLLDGRGLETADRETTQRVGVVSRSMADKYWPGESAIGKRLRIPRSSSEWITVVGVSGDVIHDWFNNRNRPTLYVPMAQQPTHSINVVVRSAATPTVVEDGIRSALTSIDNQLPLFEMMTMEAKVEQRAAGLSMVGNLMAVFGGVALVLAGIGIFSIMNFYVALRRRDIGIRLALGASPFDVLRSTLLHASWLTGIGVVIGLGLGLALAKLMEQALFGAVSPNPALFAGVTVTLILVALMASFVPAHMATKVDPATTLRN